MCLSRLSLCLFQVIPDLEVLSPTRERMGARKGCCLQACLERVTLVASGCWQRVSYKSCLSFPSEDKCFPLLSPHWAQTVVCYIRPSWQSVLLRLRNPYVPWEQGWGLHWDLQQKSKSSGERAARVLKEVKAVPAQGTLKHNFTLQASSLLRLVLPYVFWHMQLCWSPALANRMPEISSAVPVTLPAHRGGKMHSSSLFC